MTIQEMERTEQDIINDFRDIVFPKIAEDLCKVNYEGCGELDKKEFLEETTILLDLAQKGLQNKMNNYGIIKGRDYVIKPCAVGYEVYAHPIHYHGELIEGLHMTAPTKQECIDVVIEAGATYTEELTI